MTDTASRCRFCQCNRSVINKFLATGRRNATVKKLNASVRKVRYDRSVINMLLATAASLIFVLFFSSKSNAASPFGEIATCEIPSSSSIGTSNGDSFSSVFFPASFVSPLPVATDVQKENSSLIRGNCNDLSRLAIEPFRGRTALHAFGEWGNCGTEGNTNLDNGFKTTVWGGGLGRDWLFGSNFILGCSLDASQIDLDPTNNAYHFKSTMLSGQIHLSIFGNLWYLDLSAGAGRNWSEGTMTHSAGVYQNKYNGTQWNYEADLGLRIRQGYTRIEPLLGFHVSTLDEPGMANVYPSDNAIVIPISSSLKSMRSVVGSRFAWEYAGNLATISPMMIAAWIHEFGDRELFVSGETVPFPVVWRFGNNTMSRDRLHLGVGITFALRDCVDLFFHYNSTIAKNYNGYTIFGGLNKKW